MVPNGSSLNLSFINHLNIKQVRLSFAECAYYSLNGDEKFVCYNEDSYVKYSPPAGSNASDGQAIQQEENLSYRLILQKKQVYSIIFIG